MDTLIETDYIGDGVFFSHDECLNGYFYRLSFGFNESGCLRQLFAGFN
jgi:hypothetical protein